MTDCTTPPGLSDRFLVMFSPDNWSPAQRFRLFLGPPFPRSPGLLQATMAGENRRQKLFILADLANQLRAGLAEDREQLERDGYTPATRSKRFSAVAETLFLELYSSLDVLRTTLFEAYRHVRCVQNKSTEKLFRRADEGAYGPEFPEIVRQSLASAMATWYPELRRIRVEVSHGDVGSCHIDPASNHVVYMHGGLGTGQRAFVIEDLEGTVSKLSANVLHLIDTVFSFLCSQLEPRVARVPCGIFQGRIYERDVAYSDDLDFHSGACHSRQWFEDQPERLCPLRSKCSAYLQTSPTAAS